MRRSYKGVAINTSKNTHETVFSLLTQNKDAVVVDIPSGSGAFVLRLKDHGYQHIKAIDIENTLAITHDDFSIGDMSRTLPLKNESCDAVVCIDGIEHIGRQYDFVKECHRVLKKGGELIISTPNISALRSRWKWLTTGHHHKCIAPLDENNPNPLHHISMISFHEMRYLLHTQGFKIQRVTTNRIKAISWLYLPLVPFVFLFTLKVYLKTGKRENTQQINREVMKSMFSKALLFGEGMIVRAVKFIDY